MSQRPELNPEKRSSQKTPIVGTNTPRKISPRGHQIIEQSIPSLAGAGAAAGTAVGVGLLTKNPWLTGASAIGVGSAFTNLQVAGENFQRGKEEPAVRRHLGVAEDIPYSQLEPDQQKQVADFVGPIAQTRTFPRLKDAGLIEAVSYIGNVWARYLLDVVAGATAEEVDRLMYAESIVDGLVEAGVPAEKAPELLQEVLSLGPTRRETLLQAFVMEAALSGAPTIAEAAIGDHRVDPFKTKAKQLQLMEEKALEAVEDTQRKEQESLAKQQQTYVDTIGKLREQAQKQALGDEKLKQEEAKTEGILQKIWSRWQKPQSVTQIAEAHLY